MPEPEIYYLGHLLQLVINRLPDRPTINYARKCLIDLIKKQLKYVATEVHEFEFKGTQVWCDNPNPHPPHVVDYYYNDGRYQYYCLGRSGQVSEPKISEGVVLAGTYLGIVVEEHTYGSPEKPSRAKGFYFYM